MSRRALRALLALLLLPLAAPAAAEPVTWKGLTFSDEMGGFEILGVWGSGSVEDPITVVEDILGTDPAILVIRGLGPSTGNPIPTNHPAGFALRKIVTNRTDQTWTFYDIEMQKVLGTPSDIYDGLSFGQDSQAGRPFVSNLFERSLSYDEPRDAIHYSDGVLRPGETASFSFVVTATGAVPAFFLIQRPSRPVAGLAMARPPVRRDGA